MVIFVPWSDKECTPYVGPLAISVCVSKFDCYFFLKFFDANQRETPEALVAVWGSTFCSDVRQYKRPPTRARHSYMNSQYVFTALHIHKIIE